MDLISVIVPVYRVEKYLERCVESIVNQTYKNIEIILVDDGSPDRCPEMCDEWAKIDNRVKVIHQENRGGGDARNKALDIAKGKYIIFVDSDDYISPIMFEFLYQQFRRDIDIVECGYVITTDDNARFDEMKKNYQEKLFTMQAAMEENIKDCIFRQLIWNKMYRRSVIGDIRFPQGKKIDDEFWTYLVLGNAKKLIFTDKVLYAYRQQAESVMHFIDVRKRLEAIEARIQRHKYICKEIPMLEEVSLCSIWGTCIFQGQLTIKALPEKEQREILDNLENVLIQFPLKVRKIQLPFKQKIWFKMADMSFVGTCKIRNFLGIGI